MGNIERLLRAERERERVNVGVREGGERGEARRGDYRREQVRNVAQAAEALSQQSESGGRRGRLKRKVNRNRWRNKRRRLRMRELRSRLPNLFTNYSDHQLTEGQKALLNRGPNFVPTRPSVNRTEIEVSNSQWERKMLWKEFWYARELEEGSEYGEVLEEGPRSSYLEGRILKDTEVKVNLPRRHSAPAELKNCIAATKFDVLSSTLNKVKDNLSQGEREGLKELKKLQQDQKIVIKKSDKAGGVVIMNFHDYKEEGEKKLRETFTEDGVSKPKYKLVSDVILRRQHRQLQEIIEEGVERELICTEDAAIMLPQEPTPGRFYMNPKDHKRPDPVTNLPPMREVVSGSGSNTEGISKVVTYYINPVNRKQPSYLEDTRHILAEIKEINQTLSPLPQTTRLVTIDVVAMYPSIPPREGLAAMKRALQREGMAVEKIEYLTRLTEMVLNCNVFEWNGKLYQQQFGTAIGTPLAPPYSGLFMGELERTAMEEWATIHPDQDLQLQRYKRMIDDGWGLWTGPVEILFEFLQFMNNRYPSIKFTMEVSCLPDCDRADDHSCSQVVNYQGPRNHVNYLDVSMWVDSQGRIQTDLFRKPNTKCQYLLPSSAHPRHCFPGIAKSLAHRVVRICSRLEDRYKRLEELRELLLGRGYNARMLSEVIGMARSMDRDQALEKVERVKMGEEDRVHYVVTYDPRLPPIPQILGRNWRTMCERDRRLPAVFTHPPRCSMKKGRNVANHLIRARLAKGGTVLTRSVTGDSLVGARSCGRIGQRQMCCLCPHLGPAADPRRVVQEVVIHHTGDRIKINQNINCTDEGCVYLLSCTKPSCKKQYIGESGRALYKRFREHRDSAEDPETTCPVGIHFQLPGHSKNNMEMIPLEIVRGCRATRKQRERNLINRHQMIRFGLNINL